MKTSIPFITHSTPRKRKLPATRGLELHFFRSRFGRSLSRATVVRFVKMHFGSQKKYPTRAFQKLLKGTNPTLIGSHQRYLKKDCYHLSFDEVEQLHTLLSTLLCRRFNYTPLKLTAKAPENGWLEYDRFLLGWAIFRCELLVSGSVVSFHKSLTGKTCFLRG